MNRTVIYSSPFVPAEWIAAHGMTPERIAPGPAETKACLPITGVCPYARAFVAAGETSDAAAVVFATTCDQMRRIADLVDPTAGPPTFVMNVPHTWRTETAFEQYLRELERLGRFLVSLGGSSPSPDRMCHSEHSEESGPEILRCAQSDESLPVALIGGHLVSGPRRAFELIEQAGGRVALNATETGERCRPGPLDPASLARDPLVCIAKAYFRALPEPFRRPNDEFFAWLARGIRSSGVRGAILWRYVWCDTWHAEVQRIRECVGVPLLDLDTADDPSNEPRTLSRLQAFMETIS